MRAEISKAVQKLYARWGFWSTSQRPALSESRYPIFLIGLVSISDFSDWASFMGRHAVYAFAWPVAAGAEIDSWRGPSGLPRWLR